MDMQAYKEWKSFMAKYDWFCNLLDNNSDVTVQRSPILYHNLISDDNFIYHAYSTKDRIIFKLYLFAPKKQTLLKTLSKKYNMEIMEPKNYRSYQFALFIPFNKFDDIYTLNKLKFS